MPVVAFYLQEIMVGQTSSANLQDGNELSILALQLVLIIP